MSYKVCPKCEQHRPVEEVLCQTPEANDICGWDLTQERVVVPTSEAPPGPIKSLCPNGHAIRPGDLLCGECNAPIEYPQERESAGPGPGAEEGPQPDYDAGPTTRINGWEVLSRISASGAATEVFHVRHEGRGDGILTLWGCDVKPDPTVYDALPGLEPRPAAGVLERGNVEGRAFEVVSTSGAVSLAEIAHDAWRAENIRAFVAAAASSLHAMGRGGIRHRDIRPEALLIGGEESTAVAICRYGQARLSNRDLDTAVPSELTRYTAPECLAGAVTPAADWWSFGIVLLERLTKGSCFEGVNDQAYLMSVVAHGVELPASIPEDFALLLSGLLFRDRAKRWQWAEVEAWLRGEPIAAPSEPQARDTTDVAGFVLGGRSYRRPALYALAAAQPENWVEAREQLVRGQVTTWLEELKGGERMRAALRAMLRRDNLDDDTRLAIALKVLNPDMPLVLSGHIVTPNWLLAFPSEAYRLISGEAPELLQQLGFEPWLTSLKQRLDQVQKRAKLHDIELNEDMLRIQALCTSRLTLDDQWEAQRRLSPDSEHKGLTALMDRRQLSDEDLVLLLSAGKGQFTPLHELVRSASELARREGVTTFNEEAAVELLQLPRREVLGRLNERIENFSRCGKQRLDEWADQYRLERRINLPRAAVILSVAKEKWLKPPKQDYVAKLLDFFEKRITASVSRGALARMTITRTSPRIDLTEFGTARVPASALLDQLLERSDATLTIDPSVFGLDPLLERRLRTLVSRADLLRRDTGINGLYLGFPFVLVQPRGENVKPRIAPVLLWPIRIGTEVGQRARFTVAFDRDREEVRLNPALQNVFSPEEVERWKGARDFVLSGSTTAGTVMDQFSLLTQRVRQSDLARLPSADVKVVAGTTELTSAAVFFHVTFVGQAIVEDIRQLKAIPPKGTGLEALLRVQEAKPKPVLPTPAGEGLDRYTTADSDPTQDLAVLQSRTAPGLVVEGPPGTGKSQTIVNLVADAIGRKKSILIVCQKQAALDVVFKRLQREGLDDRLMLVRDESKDRRTVIQAVRDQVTALFTNGAPSTLWVRQRKDVLERIKRLEDQLNAHQDALHRRDEVSGLTYREIVGELISVEEAGTLPDVLELRKSLALMEAEPVQAAREACSSLAALWLPSEFENSPLAQLKAFGWDQQQIAQFYADLEAFVAIERTRPCAGKEASFDVDDAETLRNWSDKAQPVLSALTDSGADQLGFLIDAFVNEKGPQASGPDSLATLTTIRRELAALPVVQRDAALVEAVEGLSDLALEGWIALTGDTLRKVSTLGRLRPSRFFKRKKVREYLRQSTPVVTDSVAAAFLSVAEHERSLRGLRTRLNAVLIELGFGQQDLVRAQVGELTGYIDGLYGVLASARDGAAVIATSPVLKETLRAVRTRQAEGVRQHFGQVQDALVRHAGRTASFAALDALAPWFEREWLAACHQRIRSNQPTADLVAPVVKALPCLVPYQQFRVRVKNQAGEVRRLFAAMRPLASWLNTSDASRLSETVGRLIRREALLAWKSRLEHADQRLLSEHDELETAVTALASAEAELQQINRRATKSNISVASLRTLTEWTNVTRFTGPRALRLREFMDMASEIGLMELRPVWLMGPDVASRMLPLKPALFDTIVYDEASQMPVEFAVPSLFRGNVVVVSGDEKQLPPTSFFSNRVASDDDEAELDEDGEDLSEEELAAATETWNRREIKDCPNLLDLAKSSLPTVMLKVHYRSAFRELISFSNNAFYDGQLNVPVRHPQSELARQRPLEVIQVNGIYEERTNRAEADEVVNRLADIWLGRGRSIPSVGVVTFNRDQADLIELRLEERAEEDASFRAAYIRERQRIEAGEDMGFFVKNVENVQGDERDQIIFSTTFGRNGKGAFRRNFGVLSQGGGERRLNVAVTRARQKVTLLTSMPLDQVSGVLAGGGKPQTPRDYLQLYLAYAVAMSMGKFDVAERLLEQALRDRRRSDDREIAADDGFLGSVHRYLEILGLRPTPASDGSAFGIDFAIDHPTHGTYGLGVECGAHRHPILAHARAREIWRRGVMHKAIPVIHRVSLRGWYHSREAEQARLQRAIELALR